MQHTGNTTNSLWESVICRQWVFGMTWGSMRVTEDLWRMLSFEMEYKVSCLCRGGGLFLMWGPGGQCPDSSEKMRPACDDFTSPGPDTLQKQLSIAWAVFPLWHFQAKNAGLLALTSLFLSLITLLLIFTLSPCLLFRNYPYSSLLPCFIATLFAAHISATPPTLCLHLTYRPRPLLFISLSRKWLWVANLTWFPLTLTSRVAGPAATSGSGYRFSQGGWEMGLAGLVGLRAPHAAPCPRAGVGLGEDTH